jgi:hypothetical protein
MVPVTAMVPVMDTTERWLPIPGFDEYEVSDQGRVRSWNARRTKPELLPKVLKIRPSPNGYLTVKLSHPSKKQRFTIQKLVLLAFRGPRPEGLECRHLDGDHNNNCLDNLVYGTHSENMRDKVAHGNHHQANKTHCIRGHSLAEHAQIRPEGWRRCMLCAQEDNERYKARRRAARLVAVS